MWLRKRRDDQVCRCGHPRAAHQHYRGGTDCALCLTCPRFRLLPGQKPYLAALLRRVHS